MTSVKSGNLLPAGFDFTDPDLLAQGMPVEEFALLRKTAPVWWNAQAPGSYVIDDGGYWVISRHADIRAISRNNELWSASANGTIMRLPEGMTAEQLELTKVLLINNDPPAHTRLRKLVSPLFTPRAVAVLESGLGTAARELVTDAADKESGDFVEDVAMRLPLLAIANLLGVPKSDHRQLFDWTNSMMNSDDPDFGGDPATANAELVGYFYAMAEERRRRPADDIVSRLIHAEIDGEQLGEDEFAFFVVLLAVAGNETTRNALTQGMNAFLDHPDQWRLYQEQHPSTAVEEVVRWASPVHFPAQRRCRLPGCPWLPCVVGNSESGCSIAPPTTTKPSSTSRLSSTSCETPTRIWVLAAPVPISVSVRAWLAWKFDSSWTRSPTLRPISASSLSRCGFGRDGSTVSKN